jgi:hypothetical protein
MMSPLETPFSELSRPFDIDQTQVLKEACIRTIDESITPEEKKIFY